MSHVDFKESQIPEKFAAEIEEKTAHTTQIPAEFVERLVKALTTGIANQAKLVFSKDKVSSVIIDDLKGTPLLSAIVRYFEPDGDDVDENDTGNVIFSFTFDPEDVKDTVKYYLSEMKNQKAILDTAAGVGVRFTEASGVYLALTSFADSLIKCLDENASESETFEIELEDYFTASVSVIDGKKVFEMVPHGALKQILKKDSLKQR